jgi:hypothetical protein
MTEETQKVATFAESVEKEDIREEVIDIFLYYIGFGRH